MGRRNLPDQTIMADRKNKIGIFEYIKKIYMSKDNKNKVKKQMIKYLQHK